MNIIHALSSFATWAIQSGGYAGIILTMALESLMIPIPSEIILPFGGYLAASGSLNLFGVVLAGAIGGTIGSVALFYFSMFFGNAFFKRWGKYVLISEKHLDMIEEWFGKYGNFTVFTLRLLPIVRGLISIPAGIARMNIFSFTAYTFMGTFVWSIVLGYFGFQMGLSNIGMKIVWIIVFSLVAIAAGIYFGFKFVRKHQRLFANLVNAMLWTVFVFFIAYSLYQAYYPIKTNDLNYSNQLRIENSGPDFSFYAIGNTFYNTELLDNIVSNSSAASPDFVVGLGNMVYSGDLSKYRILVGEIRHLKVPFMTVPGMNDLKDGGYSNYYHVFGNYDYAAHAGSTFFAMLNDANGRLSPQQLIWLSAELSKASTYVHRIVVMNIPAGWMKPEGKKLDPSVSAELEKTLKTHRVDLVLSTGRPARYSEGPIPYAMIGSDQYASVSVSGTSLSVEIKGKMPSKNGIERFFQFVSVYTYTFLILEWPIIGLVGVGVLILWFLIKTYRITFKIEKRSSGK